MWSSVQSPSVAAAAATAPTQAADSGKKTPAPKAVPNKKQTRGGVRPAVFGSMAALTLIAAAALIFWPHHRQAAPLPVSAFVSPQAAANSREGLGAALDGVIAAAQKLNRPRTEVTALGDAKTKILDLVSQKRSGAADEMKDAARSMAKAELAALGRSSRRTWRDLGGDPKLVSDSANTIAALKTTKADLDAKLGADLTALDAAGAITATRQGLDAYAVFQTAFLAAAPQYVLARKQDLTNLLTTAQTTTDQIVALAGVSEPWFLASQARKQAYKLRQENAAHAKALFTQLSSAASVAQSSKDLKVVAGAIAQLTEGQATLANLHAASAAAKL